MFAPSTLRKKPTPHDGVHTVTRQTKNRNVLSSCLICNAEARIINYGALSCYSCKTFFHRHSFRSQNIRPCELDNHCEITTRTRQFCPSCRFNKCLAVGMTKELIRKKYQRKQSSAVAQPNHNEIYVIPKASLDLLYNDRSSLDNFEWNLLSNVVHAFDRYSLVPSMRHMIEYVDKNEPNIDVHPSDTFNLFASFYTSVQSFICSTADFRVLTIAEQSSLFQRNLHGLFNICGTFMLRDAGMFDDSRNESILVPLYGQEIVRQAKRITRRLDYDSTLVKIIHMIFAFSTNCYTISYDPYMNTDALLRGTFRLLGSQNLYTEILWKYMIYRYGYRETVFRFTALVKQMLDLINLSAEIYINNPHHQVLVDDLVETAKITLVLDDNEDTLLWGKT